MKTKIQSSYNILDFYDFDNDAKMKIHEYLEDTMRGIDTSMLADWTLILCLVFGKSEWIGVYTKGITYAKTKERVISVVIPIPTTEQIRYGISKKKFAHRPNLNPAKFMKINIDYLQYESMQELIVDCAKKGVDAAFQKGIKINGILLKSPDASRSSLNNQYPVF